MERIKEITIRGVDNGIVVHVGCKVLVYPQEDLKTFIEDLSGYLSYPEEKEIEIGKRWGFDLVREDVSHAFEDENIKIGRVHVGRKFNSDENETEERKGPNKY